MTARTQKRIAILGTLVAISLFVAANAHLVSVAFSSRPACAALEAGPAPARRVC